MSKASCFLDSYAWLLHRGKGYSLEGIREMVREAVYHVAPDFDHDELGYHPHVLNAAVLQLGLPALSPVDACPCDGAGKPICMIGLIDEPAVVVGINEQGVEHAVAVHSRLDLPAEFHDPATGELSDTCPLPGVRTQWVVTW